MSSQIPPRVIFDNAGGITLQLPEYAYRPDGMTDGKEPHEIIAALVAEYQRYPQWVKYWDNCDSQLMTWDPPVSEITSGGYKIWVISDGIPPEPKYAGTPTQEFFEHLSKIKRYRFFPRVLFTKKPPYETEFWAISEDQACRYFFGQDYPGWGTPKDRQWDVSVYNGPRKGGHNALDNH